MRCPGGWINYPRRVQAGLELLLGVFGCRLAVVSELRQPDVTDARWDAVVQPAYFRLAALSLSVFRACSRAVLDAPCQASSICAVSSSFAYKKETEMDRTSASLQAISYRGTCFPVSY